MSRRGTRISDAQLEARTLLHRTVMRCFALFSALFFAAASASADDVVITHDGAEHHGTILEVVPGEYVVIADARGERTRIDGADVRFAGPADRAPTAQLAPGAGVRVDFDGEVGATYHRVTAARVGTAWRDTDLVRLCSAPCSLTLPAGSYRFALSDGGGTWIGGEALDLMHSGHVSAVRFDRSGLRLAGWLTLSLGVAAGLAMMTIPFVQQRDDRDAWLIAGGSVLGAAAVVGIPLIAQADTVAIRFD